MVPFPGNNVPTRVLEAAGESGAAGCQVPDDRRERTAGGPKRRLRELQPWERLTKPDALLPAQPPFLLEKSRQRCIFGRIEK
jgi:hypothetical protein